MSRRLVTRAFAPLVAVFLATAVPHEGFKSQAYQWATETVTAALAMLAPGTLRDAAEHQLVETNANMSHLGAEINRRVVEGSADAGRLYDMASLRMSAAMDVISDTAESIVARLDKGLAHVDGWMTAVSLKVIAALPGAPDQVPAPLSKRQHPVQTPVVTASVAHAPPPPSPFGAQLDAGKTPDPRLHKPLPEKFNLPAAVGLPAVTPQTKAEPAKPEIKIPPALQDANLSDIEVIPAQPNATAIVMPAPVPVGKPPATPDVIVVTSAAPEPAQPEIKLTAPAPAEAQAGSLALVEVTMPAPPAFDEKSLLASLGLTNTTTLATPVEQPAPVPVAPSAGPAPRAKTAPAREEKPEEKLVVASLSQPVVPMDIRPLVVDKPAEAKAVPVIAPFDADEQNLSPAMDLFPASATRLPSSTPLKMRPLTRADIPSSEKFASLTSTKSDTRSLPTEHQRVAYDAPVPMDEPTSIGRRKWVEEANKYQGLGRPEALLEALRHMGSNAKTLGLPASLWCADFMNLVLRKSGIKATGSRAAKSYLEYGQKIDEPRVGAIAIFSRGRNGGHIGIVRGTDGNGNPIIVSGNHNHKVAEATYPKARVLAYVVPR